MTIAVGVPAEMVDQMRQSPMWPGLEAVAHTIAYDGTIMGDTMRGDPRPLQKWASVSVPTLVMDGGSSPTHMHTGAQEITSILPNAQRRTLAGHGHGPADEILAPALEAFFLS